MEQITIAIKNGMVEMEVEGVKGMRCVELTQGIEQLLGKSDTRVLKQGFYGNTQKSKQKIDIKSLSTCGEDRNC